MKPVLAKTFCTTHYHRYNRHGDPLAYKKVRHICSVEDCGCPVVGNGLCDKHYRRLKRYGTTDLPDRPVLEKPPRPGRECSWCGEEIPYGTNRSKFCSRGCSELAAHEVRLVTGRAVQLKRYGITVEKYGQLFEAQAGKCAICGSTDPGRRSEYLAVDHDHSCCSGKRSCGKCVRGLLCVRCNSGLGHFKDDPRLLEAALHYLASAD